MTATDAAMQALYQQLILDHAKQRTGFGLLTSYDGESFQKNPICGDEVKLRVKLERPGDTSDGDVLVVGVGWEGAGCSISQASLSVLNELVVGKPLREVLTLEDQFTALMHSRGQGVDDATADALGDAAAFEGVSRFPARIKCALLGWSAVRDAIARALVTDGFVDLADNYQI